MGDDLGETTYDYFIQESLQSTQRWRVFAQKSLIKWQTLKILSGHRRLSQSRRKTGYHQKARLYR